MSKKQNAVNSDQVQFIRALHKSKRDSSDEYLKEKSKEELIDYFNIEMDAKNQAYYFILEHGHFLDFREYCYKQWAEEEIMNQKLNKN